MVPQVVHKMPKWHVFELFHDFAHVFVGTLFSEYYVWYTMGLICLRYRIVNSYLDNTR